MKATRELIAVFGLLSAIFAVVFNYRDLPQRIPTHFDATGIANGWGDKSALWALVGIACVLYLGFTLVRFIPAKFINVPVRAEQRAAAIPVALEMLAWLKAETACIFAYIIVSIVSIAQARSLGLSPWFMPLTMIVLFATIAFYLTRMRALAA
jgi:uncharacterized membrane protein